MKLHSGVWFPDHEQHMLEWCDKHGEIVDGKTTYQIKKLRAALEFAKDFRTCIDIGAHIGLWSMHLVKRFKMVQAFEPIAEHRDCFMRNVPENNCVLHPLALGDAPGSVALTIPAGSSGGTHITGAGEIEMRTLDSFGFENVDLIKIDVEGFERAVLEGAILTLRQWKPCVIVEQKQHIMQANYGTSGRPAVEFLETIGYVQRKELGGDFILTCE